MVAAEVGTAAAEVVPAAVREVSAVAPAAVVQAVRAVVAPVVVPEGQADSASADAVVLGALAVDPVFPAAATRRRSAIIGGILARAITSAPA
jgi:hypothetical protein